MSTWGLLGHDRAVQAFEGRTEPAAWGMPI